MKMNEDQLIQKQIERELFQQEEGLRRYQRQLKQREEGKDFSRSAGGKFITKYHLADIIELVRKEFSITQNLEAVRGGDVIRMFQDLKKTPLVDLDTGLQKLTPKGSGRVFCPWKADQIAALTLQSMLDVCRMPLIDMDDPDNHGKRFGARPTLSSLEVFIGTKIEQQTLLNYLRRYFPDRGQRLGFISKRLSESIRKQAGMGYKMYNTDRIIKDSANYFAEQGRGILADIFDWRPWGNNFRWQLGNKLMRLVIDGLYISDGEAYFQECDSKGERIRSGDVSKDKRFLGFTALGDELVDDRNQREEVNQFFHIPMLAPPKPHTQDAAGGYYDITVPALQKVVSGMFKGNLNLSQEHLVYLNNAQSVGFRVNNRLLEVMETFYGANRDGRNLGKFKPLPKEDEWVTPWDDELKVLKKADKGYHKKKKFREQRREELAAFHTMKDDAKQTFTEELMTVARMCKDDETIYLPTFSDFRGRSLVRGLAISYQGSDPHKALLEWSEGIEADEFTEFWLMIEMTAYMAGGLDKKPFGDRCGAIHINRENIIASVRDPYGHKWWQSKDNIKKPWLWLAAAQEWVRLYVDNDPDRKTHARTSIDATCSGQQYFAGLLACIATAAQVNLLDSDTPSDVYTNVLAVMMRDIEEKDGAIHAVNDDGKELGLIDKDKMDILRSADRSEIRGGVKGVVVCGQYGAGKETRIEAFIKDCDAVEFTKDEARGIYQSIKVGLNECLPAMDLILEWIQKVARESLEKTDRQYLVLPAADGSTVVQRYPKMEGNGRVSLDNLGTQGYRKRRKAVSVKPSPKTDKKDQVISCAANLIHAQDGATLVLALYDYDKPFSATHDSIAGRPSKEMNDIRDRLLGSLYKVFTSDVLRQFVELNGLDWEEYKAPVVGTYDPKSVLTASKAYC